MTEFHIIGLGNLCEFVIKDIDNNRTHGVFSACSKHSDKEHLMGCLIRFFGYDDEDIDYNLNRESNREYGKQYYSMKEETKKELEK